MTPPVVAPPPSPEPEPPAPDYNTEEFRGNPGLAEIGALSAYEAGYFGTGVTIALLDSGIDDQHPDLDANIHPESRDFGGNGGALFDDTMYDISENPNIITSVIHGTAVAGIMVAERNGAGMHGVAPEAQVLALRMDLPELASWGGKDLNQAAVGDAIDHAIANDAKVLMVEWAFWDESANQYAGAEHQIDEAYYIAQEYREPIRAAFQRAIDAGMLIVIPAGNEYGSAPTAFISQLGLEEKNRGSVIIVGSVDREQQIYDRSNRAGYAQDYYVVAPSRVTTTAPTRGIGEGRPQWAGTSNGTSFAGPHVAAAAALLMQAFPNLTAAEVAEILFETARDLGAVGTDEIYGLGMIDLAAAFEPSGELAAMTRAGSPVTMANTMIEASTAFGDAFDKMPTLLQVVALDSYRRAYRQNLAGAVTSRRVGPNVSGLLDQVASHGWSRVSLSDDSQFSFSYTAPARLDHALMDALPYAARTAQQEIRDVSFAFSQSVDARTDIKFSMGRGGVSAFPLAGGSRTARSIVGTDVSMDAFSTLYRSSRALGLTRQVGKGVTYSASIAQYETQGEGGETLFTPAGSPRARAAAVAQELGWRGASWRLALGGGMMEEAEGFLASRSGGALKLSSGSRSYYVSASGEKHWVGGWSLRARYTVGSTSARMAEDSFVEAVTPLRTKAFAAQLMKQGVLAYADRLVLSVSQPLAVTSGSFTAFLPLSQDRRTGDLVYERVIGQLAPDDRQKDFELMYEFAAQESGFTLRANMLYQQNPGNRAGQHHAFLLQAALPF
ncbi:S8 family peptidase [Kordiimonas gwangyangensis]|uniref:S8 family peptidase n=2 Tax=Kordiimonas gwangyangensis TaxID=288022 RepID=UPI00035FF6F2|nr:S8 family peptidase [Kordiimonas gwangyangensis]